MKLEILSKNANVSRESAALMIQLYRKPFQIVNPEKISELIQKGLAWESGNAYTSSTECDEAVEQAAEEWFSKAGMTLAEKNVRKPREVSSAMQEQFAKLKDAVNAAGIPIKEESERRSNLRIALDGKFNSVKMVEIRQEGILRLYGYRSTTEQLKHFETLGCTFRVSGLNNYIDIPVSDENIIKLINNLK